MMLVKILTATAMAGSRSDNLSRKTTSTGVCETSQTEYISKSKDDDDEGEEEEESGGGDGRGQEKSSDDREEDGKVEEMAQLNVKMLFLHNEQVTIQNQICKVP